MNMSEEYDKILWIYKMPEVIFNNFLSENRLKSLSDRARQGLIFKVIETLSQYFSVVPDYYYDSEIYEANPDEDINGVNATLTIWLNGLADLSVKKIIEGLLDILNMKTEYQKWPPKSVMQFYAVCKSIRPAPYHEIKSSNNYKQIGFDEYIARKRSEDIAEKHISDIFKKLGKDYDKIKERREIEKRLAFKS